MFSHNFITVVMTTMALLCPSLPCGECCTTCPVVDVAESVESVESVGHSEKCCGRCQTVAENQAEKHHSPLEPDCPAGSELLDCFCGGAILSVGVDFSANVMCVDFLSPACDAMTLLQLSTLSQLELQPPNRCHFPPLSSGRDLCALTGSYLL